MIVRAENGDWLVVFNKFSGAPLLYPPSAGRPPLFYNVLIRSHDQGKTWTAPRVVPGYDWYGVECAGLSPLSDGTLLLNQWRFRWYPLETAKKLAYKNELLFPKGWLDEVKVLAN